MDFLISTAMLSGAIGFLVYFFKFYEEDKTRTKGFLIKIQQSGLNPDAIKEIQDAYVLLNESLVAEQFIDKLPTIGFGSYQGEDFLTTCKGEKGDLLFTAVNNQIHSCIYSQPEGDPIRLVCADEFGGRLVS